MSQNLAEFLYQERLNKASTIVDIPDLRAFTDQLLGLIYPERGNLKINGPEDVEMMTDSLKFRLKIHLKSISKLAQGLNTDKVSEEFWNAIPKMVATMDLDAQAAFNGDPAAYSIEEIIISYPGFYTICLHRIAHELWIKGVPLIPRLIAEYAHQKTGIDIHPGAKIAESFFIDHGTGVVIGETSEIGKNVKIYQGVTLGALSVKKKMQAKKRHPTIEDDVVIYANTTILGGQTVVGKGSIIGGNVWLTESVSPGSVIFNLEKSIDKNETK